MGLRTRTGLITRFSPHPALPATLQPVVHSPGQTRLVWPSTSSSAATPVCCPWTRRD